MNHNSFPEPPTKPESLLGQFFRFLRRPLYTVNIPKDHPGIGDILRLYSLVILTVLALGLISSMVADYIQSGHILEDDKTLSPANLVVFGVFIAPLVEEMIFRLPLRYTPLNLTLPLHFLLVILVLILVGTKILPAIAAMPLIVTIISAGLLLRHWLKLKVNPKKIHTFYEKFIGWLVYLSTLSFGLIHITNFTTSFQGSTWLLAPLLVLPQIALGFFLAFVRLRHGFWWSVFTHGFHNACALTPLLLLQLVSPSLRANLEAGKGFKDAVGQDALFVSLIVVFLLGGIMLCAKTGWELIKEWRAEAR
ncbi:MAG: CPBP family intramembrane metalloprotease [Acaryochloridaceae cyanobacterium SU_2_1]|nr:CPBP family intramembrane metalloprotease [Acaryochloridaceae cyanobacterium SU_2_1]